MNQAKYMIQKGGGESKIQLNPEGLGEIHMKVSVKDGKVDLQIATQTHEAKKLVESSMHELKDSLSQKNLGMEAVKVDVGNHLAGDKHHSDQQTQDQSQQRQFDLKQDMSRDQSKSQTRQFWNQFNDDGGFSRRAAILDSPGIRAYGGGRKTEPLQPADTRASTESRRYVQSGKGRGIDLVA
jgi:flagellar hook-length control protein FliK